VSQEARAHQRHAQVSEGQQQPVDEDPGSDGGQLLAAASKWKDGWATVPSSANERLGAAHQRAGPGTASAG
jgi:hypothetical protein